MIKVILDERDTDRLLRLLYNGARPKRVHTLVCSCGQTADLRKSECAWNGWQVLPHARCPWCIESHPAHPAELYWANASTAYPHLAEERFLQLISAVREG